MTLKDVQKDITHVANMTTIFMTTITEDTENAIHFVTEIMTADITSRDLYPYL